MKVVSLNVNGIRAAAKKGFYQWLNDNQPDFVCLQEVRAETTQLVSKEFYPENYHCYYVSAEKKGYSGVAIYTKKKPNSVINEIGYPLSNCEGRFIQANYDECALVSLYLPSGTSGDLRQQEKYGFMDFLYPWMQNLQKEFKYVILCGDWNIAHTKKDIRNWRGNQKNSGFLPEERAWLDQVFYESHWVDAFRMVVQEDHHYTWWSNRGKAWANNVGWRIDYQIVSPSLKEKIQSAEIYKAERFSDHAPLIIDYDLKIK